MALVFAVPLLSGCGDAIHNYADDDRYIRSPDESTPGAAATTDASLFPAMAPGTRHPLRLTLQSAAARALTNGGSTIDTTSQVGTADLVYSGSRAVPGGGTGMVVDTRVPGRDAPIRSDVYTTDHSGVYLSGLLALPNTMLMLSSPLTLAHYPVHEGDVHSWAGTATGNGGTITASGYSRVSNRTELTLPNNPHPVNAYQIDTVMDLQFPARGLRTLTTRWFAPGLGVVRERFAAGMNRVTLERMDSGAR